MNELTNNASIAQTSPTAHLRNSSIELLRIICMVLIILHHVIVHSGALGMSNQTNLFISYFFVPGGKIGFDAFVAISTWFLCESKFKSQRFLKVWFEAFFYSVVFTIVAMLLGVGVDFKSFVEVLFVIFGNSHGFVAAYLLFYLLTPFLYLVSQKVSNKGLTWLVILLFGAQLFSQWMGVIFGYYQHFSSELTLFVFFYFSSLWFKRYNFGFLHKKWLMGLIVLAIFTLTLLLIYLPKTYNNGFLNFLVGINTDESGVFNIIGGYALFFLFLDIRMKPNKVINLIATTPLGILLIHDHNVLRSVFWTKIFNISLIFDFQPGLFTLSVFGFAFAVFLSCASIDLVRQYALEKPLFRWHWLQTQCEKWDALLDFSGNQPLKNSIVENNREER
jgi:hypothetical protein